VRADEELFNSTRAPEARFVIEVTSDHDVVIDRQASRK